LSLSGIGLTNPSNTTSPFPAFAGSWGNVPGTPTTLDQSQQASDGTAFVVDGAPVFLGAMDARKFAITVRVPSNKVLDPLSWTATWSQLKANGADTKLVPFLGASARVTASSKAAGGNPDIFAVAKGARGMAGGILLRATGNDQYEVYQELTGGMGIPFALGPLKQGGDPAALTYSGDFENLGVGSEIVVLESDGSGHFK